jgi:hypothetical protein
MGTTTKTTKTTRPTTVPKYRNLTETEPTFRFTLGEGAAGCDYEVWALNDRDTVRLPYCRRDGTYHTGPGFVTLCRQHASGTVTIAEFDVADPRLWDWWARLIRCGTAALRAELPEALREFPDGE